MKKSSGQCQAHPNTHAGHTFGHACLKSCRRILAQLAKSRAAIYAEARHTLQTHDRMLRLALNEAEALAWETAYPQLVFPTLATEKVQAVADWSKHQRVLRARESGLALAA